MSLQADWRVKADPKLIHVNLMPCWTRGYCWDLTDGFWSILMKLQEIEYAGLKKSDESIGVETICPILDSYSQLQMLLFFAFQHPRWQISLAQFKIFSLLKLVYFFFCLLFTILSLKTPSFNEYLQGHIREWADRMNDSVHGQGERFHFSFQPCWHTVHSISNKKES